jgi:hypothetical protein
MSHDPITPAEGEQIIKDYDGGEGLTVTQLAKKRGCQNCTIVRFLRKAGVFVKKEAWDKANSKLTPTTVAEITKAYAGGATQEVLAARFRISPTLVRNALLKAGVQPRRRGKQTDFQRVSDHDAYCSGCDTRKPLDEFHFNKATNLPMYQCKECARWGRRAKVYGISKEQYETLLKAQNGACACCHEVPASTSMHPDLVVDHDHRTGAVRGLLCARCNHVLGSLKDKPREWGDWAADYLELAADDPRRLAVTGILAALNP